MNLTDNDINLNSYREYRTDHTGATVACYFFVKGRGLIGVADAAHNSVRDLSQRLANEKGYRGKVSDKFAYDAVIDWLKLAVVTGDAPTVTDHFEYVACAQIKQREIWVPFPVIQITVPQQNLWVT